MRTALLLSLLVVSVGQNTHAQSLEELMKRAMEQSQQSAGGGAGSVTIEENNDPFEPLGFTGSYKMEVHNYKSGKEDKDSPMFVDLAFTDDKMAIAPHSSSAAKQDMRMIYDLKNKFTYTLTTDENGKRTGMKMKMMKVNVDEKEGKASSDKTKVVRTDETRTIAGHTCRKYTFSDETGSGEAWIAEDVKFDPSKAMGTMVGGKKVENWQKTPYSGLVMETTWNDANGKDKMVMYCKDLVVGKVDEAAFSTSGYEIMDMSNMPMFGK
ncbi:MAG: DUF4412 domain-containing protein [Flavobacteriales bacterium]|nr:DUF4412 domain-containing protein [Flavobacteriales bacterium]